jgi:hypothetical protein
VVRRRITRLESENARLHADNARLQSSKTPTPVTVVAAEPTRPPPPSGGEHGDNHQELQGAVSVLNHRLTAMSGENMHLQRELQRLLSARPSGLHENIINSAASEMEDLREEVTTLAAKYCISDRSRA